MTHLVRKRRYIKDCGDRAFCWSGLLFCFSFFSVSIVDTIFLMKAVHWHSGLPLDSMRFIKMQHLVGCHDCKCSHFYALQSPQSAILSQAVRGGKTTASLYALLLFYVDKYIKGLVMMGMLFLST